MSQEQKNTHKYRVSVYLGKELYQKLSEMAHFIDVPLATATRILLETGMTLGTALEKKVVNNYEQSKK